MGGGATKPATAGANNDDTPNENLIKFFGLDNSGKSLLLHLLQVQNKVLGDDDDNNHVAGLLPIPTRLSAPQSLHALKINKNSMVLQDNPGHAGCREKYLSETNKKSSCAGIVFVLDVDDQLRFGVALNFLRSVIDSHVPGRPVLLVMTKRGSADATHDASSAADQVKRYGVIPASTPWKSKSVVLPEIETPVGVALFAENAAEEKASEPLNDSKVGSELIEDMHWLIEAAGR